MESDCFWEKFWLRQVFTDERGGHISFFLRKNMVSQCRKNSWASLQSFRKIVVSGNITHNTGITFFSRKLFVSQCRKLSWDSLQFFEMFRVWKKFMHNTGYHVFPSKNSLSHSSENFRGHSFNVSEKFGYRKILCILGVSQFSAGNCLSHCSEIFCEGVLLFLRKFLIRKKVYG